MNDYYKILDVPPDAPPDEIKTQWLLLLQAWHPDKFSNPAHKAIAEEKSKGFNKAYEVLSNPQRRKAYDDVKYEEERHKREVAEAARRSVEEEHRKREAAEAAQHRAQEVAE